MTIPKERFDKAYQKFQKELIQRIEIIDNEPLSKQIKKIMLDFTDTVNGRLEIKDYDRNSNK